MAVAGSRASDRGHGVFGRLVVQNARGEVCSVVAPGVSDLGATVDSPSVKVAVESYYSFCERVVARWCVSGGGSGSVEFPDGCSPGPGLLCRGEVGGSGEVPMGLGVSVDGTCEFGGGLQGTSGLGKVSGPGGVGEVGDSEKGLKRDVLVGGRGKNYERNQVWRKKKKLAKENRKSGWKSDDWRSPASVGSSGGSGVSVGKCWTVKEESPMEKRIREALERKKAVEAELAAKKAELALERMNDRTMTDLYNARVKQEGISRMNQATQKSEQSLEQLRSVSPGSSATPGEIREALLCSEAWKLKEKKIRAWIAAGQPEGEVLAILDEGKSTEVASLDTEQRAYLEECRPCELVEEEPGEATVAEKAEVAAGMLYAQKKYIAFVAHRCRAAGLNPESGLLGPEVGVYRSMTEEEFEHFDSIRRI